MSFFKDLFTSKTRDHCQSTQIPARTPSTTSSPIPGPQILLIGATTAAWCLSQHDELIWILRSQYHEAWEKDRDKNTPRTRIEVDRLHEELSKATTAQYVNWLQLSEYCRMMKRETTEFYQGPRVQERNRAMKDMRWWERFKMWLRLRSYNWLSLGSPEVMVG